MDVRGAAQREGDHAAGDGGVGHPVDQDEPAHLAIVGVRLECDGAIERKIAERDLVEVEMLGGEVLERIHVDLARGRRWRRATPGLSRLRSIFSLGTKRSPPFTPLRLGASPHLYAVPAAQRAGSRAARGLGLTSGPGSRPRRRGAGRLRVMLSPAETSRTHSV
jgi:hypothetical protein